MLGLLEILSLSAIGLATTIWIVVVLVRPGMAPAHLHHARRARRARGWLYAPLWIPGVALPGALLPGTLAELTSFGDHCLQQGAHHHHHLCPIHPPHLSTQYGIWMVSALLGLALLALVTKSIRSHLAQWKLGKTLIATSEASPLGEDVRILDQREPIAVTLGFFRPMILLSKGLLDLVSPETIQIILEHERAHVRRRDTFWAHIDRQALCLFPRNLRRTLHEELLLAREQACDTDVAKTHGPAKVAQALTQVARHHFLTTSTALSIQDSSLTRRVLYLLDLPENNAQQSFYRGGLLVLLILATGAGPLHDILERLITLLVH